jgi:hypothetical protein
MQPRLKIFLHGNLLILLFSSISILVLLFRCAYLSISSMVNFDTSSSASLAGSILGALSMLFCSGLLVPILVLTFKRMKGQKILPVTIRKIKIWQITAMVSGWGLVVFMGAGLVRIFAYGWAVGSPFFLLGISLPILIMVWIGTGGLLISGSRRRIWVVFGYGMAGSTVIAMVLEYLLIGVAAVGIGVISFVIPELSNILEQVKAILANARSGEMQTLLTDLAPTITNPFVILLILLSAAVLAPLIEEAVKPAVIWFLGKRLDSPAEGFVLGSLCGAGFALMEGLLAASGSVDLWGIGLIGRAAASLMHITASGILGWGIASAQLKKRYDYLALAYMVSVSIHGLWNGSAIIAAYGALRMMSQNIQIDLLGGFITIGGLGMLFLLLVLMVATLPLVNHRLRQQGQSTPSLLPSDIITPLATSPSREINGMDT